MKNRYKVIYVFVLMMSLATPAYAMHISEGFLQPTWCAFYFLLCAPFVIMGIKQIRKQTKNNKDLKMLLGLVAAYSFILSAMKIPSVTGSCSHPTGTGLGAIIFGPSVMAVIGLLVLIFQAIFLAHGGITTLGANTFSMGIVGPIVSFFIYKIFKNKNKKLAVFLAACLGDMATYITTSVQLGAAFSGGNFFMAFIKFVSIFAVTQLPLAIIEGIITVIIYDFVQKYASTELNCLKEVK